MSNAAGLVAVSTSSLERIRRGLEARRLAAPLTRASLAAFGVKEQVPAILAALAERSRETCLDLLIAVLAEREHSKQPRPELVWTGPESLRSDARDTAVVLRELFARARHQVILAGYSFSKAEEVLQPLHTAMVQHGVQAKFFVNIQQPEHSSEAGEAYGQAALDAFFDANWPFGWPAPEIYCDRRALDAHPRSSLHAKCVTIDSRIAFVSSANFTASGQHYNLETGVLLDDPTFAAQLDRQWLTLIEEDLVFRRRT